MSGFPVPSDGTRKRFVVGGHTLDLSRRLLRRIGLQAFRREVMRKLPPSKCHRKTFTYRDFYAGGTGHGQVLVGAVPAATRSTESAGAALPALSGNIQRRRSVGQEVQRSAIEGTGHDVMIDRRPHGGRVAVIVQQIGLGGAAPSFPSSGPPLLLLEPGQGTGRRRHFIIFASGVRPPELNNFF